MVAKLDPCHEGTSVTTARGLADGSSPDFQDDPCLVVYVGDGLGQRFVLRDFELLIGRSRDCGISLLQDNVSRRHCKLITYQMVSRVYDLGSTNGTFVNEMRVNEHSLVHGDRIRVGSTVFKFLRGGSIERTFSDEIHRMTRTDPLTEVANRRCFFEALAREVLRARRYGRPVSLVIFDVDHFKNINDRYGHPVGDLVLRKLAQAVQANLRGDDLFCRYGGEEFAVIIPEIGHAAAAGVAEKIRQLVADLEFVGLDGDMRLHVSLGVATVGGNDTAEDPETLLALADSRLYDAKRGGRNCVVS